jgi:hypothetical protein
MTGAPATVTDHEGRARDFIDSILQVNRQYGAGEAPGVITRDDAVRALTGMFRWAREDDPPEGKRRYRPEPEPSGFFLSPLREPLTDDEVRAAWARPPARKIAPRQQNPSVRPRARGQLL